MCHKIVISTDMLTQLSSYLSVLIYWIVGSVTTLSGSGSAAYADGQGGYASFNNPSGLVVDTRGVVFVGDTGNNRVRMIHPDGKYCLGTGKCTCYKLLWLDKFVWGYPYLFVDLLIFANQ